MSDTGSPAPDWPAALAAAQGGCWRAAASPAQVDQLAAQADASGWRVVRLDTADLVDKADLMQRIVDGFALPVWFGRNWDALEDTLRDLDHRPGTAVLWTGSASLAPRLAETLWEIFDERADAPSEEAPALMVLRLTPPAG
ncbi:barstar family protein [Dermacoccaceae bacterium W4C1]